MSRSRQRQPAAQRRSLASRRSSVSGLRKKYGDHEAVRGIDFQVDARRGLRLPRHERRRQDDDDRDPRGLSQAHRRRGLRARASIPSRPPREWRDRIGMVLQESQPDPSLHRRARRVELYAGLYLAPRAVPETIDLVGLAEAAERDRVGTLSGGQRRRVDVAVGLIGDPDLDLPGRADDRLRPGGAPRRLEHDRGAEGRSGKTVVPHHALHGRGAAPRRPRGHPPRGRDRRATARPSARARHGDGTVIRFRLPRGVARGGGRLGCRGPVDRRLRRRRSRFAHRRRPAVAVELLACAERATAPARRPRGAPPEPRGRLPRAHGRRRPSERRRRSLGHLTKSRRQVAAAEPARARLHDPVPGRPARPLQLDLRPRRPDDHALATALELDRAGLLHGRDPRLHDHARPPSRRWRSGSRPSARAGRSSAYRGTPLPPWVFMAAQVAPSRPADRVHDRRAAR